MTHICVSNLTIIGSDNGLSPGRRQAIIWTNAGILLIGPLGTNFSELSIEIQTFSFKKNHLKVSSAKWRPFCVGLNVLTTVKHLLPNTICYQCSQWWKFSQNVNIFVSVLLITNGILRTTFAILCSCVCKIYITLVLIKQRMWTKVMVCRSILYHSDFIIGAMVSQIIGLSVACLTFCSGADQRKHQSSVSLAFVRGIHRWQVNSPQRASNASNLSIWWRHHDHDYIAQNLLRNTHWRNNALHTHISMMTSSNGKNFRVTRLLCGEFTGERRIPHTKASDAELWCFLWSVLE